MRAPQRRGAKEYDDFVTFASGGTRLPQPPESRIGWSGNDRQGRHALRFTVQSEP